VHIATNVIVTSSLTKAYGFDGLRCGWILCAPKLATRIWRLQDFFGVNGAVPAEQISAMALKQLRRFRRRSMSILQTNRPLVDDFLAAHDDMLEWVPSDGAPILFPKLKRRESASAFAKRLRDKYKTVVIPGNFFEMPQHFRVGFGCNTEMLRGGLRQISRALREPR
jgi:aspartate/methionine/tyrosine aminotransferase